MQIYMRLLFVNDSYDLSIVSTKYHSSKIIIIKLLKNKKKF